MGPRAVLEGYGKSHPHRDLIPGPSSPLRVCIPTALTTRLDINEFYILLTGYIGVFCVVVRTNIFISLCGINWWGFITEMNCVYSAVRPEM